MLRQKRKKKRKSTFFNSRKKKYLQFKLIKMSAKCLNNISIFSNNFNKSRGILIQNSESITWKKSLVEKFQRLK